MKTQQEHKTKQITKHEWYDKQKTPFGIRSGVRDSVSSASECQEMDNIIK